MTRYISNPDNLKLMMNMLKEKSRNIQFEAFHVFKVNLLKINIFYLIFNELFDYLDVKRPFLENSILQKKVSS